MLVVDRCEIKTTIQFHYFLMTWQRTEITKTLQRSQVVEPVLVVVKRPR